MSPLAASVLRGVAMWQEEWDPWTISNLWYAMGWLTRGIIIVLAIMLFRVLQVTFERTLRYRTARRETRKFVSESAAAMRGRDIQESLAIAKRYPRSHVAAITGDALDTFQRALNSPWSGNAAELGRHAAERTRNRIHAELAVGLDSLANIAAVATFIGLTGTLIGILNAFRGTTGSRWSVVAAIATNLAEALVTTSMGLFAAIPALGCFNYLRERLEALDTEAGNACSELLTYLKTHPVPAVAIESSQAELLRAPGAKTTSAPPWEIPYDRQRVVLFSAFASGALVFWLLALAMRWHFADY